MPPEGLEKFLPPADPRPPVPRLYWPLMAAERGGPPGPRDWRAYETWDVVVVDGRGGSLALVGGGGRGAGEGERGTRELGFRSGVGDDISFEIESD